MKLLRYKWWQYGLVFLLTLPICAHFLRQNNLHMLELRDEVVDIDQQSGDIKQIEPALTDLRNYVLTHMNATLPAPLELPGSFNVAVEQARKKAEQSGSANGQIYRKAQAECERLDIPLSVRAECIQNYVINNSKPGDEARRLDIPPREQFVYSYVSPTWSFDFAGLSILMSTIFFLLTTVKFALDVAVPKISKYIMSQPLE